MSDFKVAIILTTIIAGGLALLLYFPVSSEQLIVTSKEEQSEFRCNGSFGFLTCQTYYSYFVNGKPELQSLYNKVEEGKTYNCDKSIIGNVIDCKESEGENER